MAKLISFCFSLVLHFIVLVLIALVHLYRPTDLSPPSPPGSQEALINKVCKPENTYRIFKLSRADPIAYEVAMSISRHPLLGLKGTKFYVSCRPDVVAREAVVEFFNGRTVNTVRFSPFILRSRHFRALVAHELAHISIGRNGHTEDNELNDYLADELAEKIVSSEAIENWREEDGPPSPIVLLDPE